MNPIYLFDLDGTLIAEELIPLIGRELGLQDELMDLTLRTMQGEIPFESSFLKRVELLSRIPQQIVTEIVLSAPILEDVLKWIHSSGEEVYVVTGNLDCWVTPWLREHNLKGFTSKARFNDERIFVEHILIKEKILENFTGRQIIMIGDGANDAGIMEKADYSIGTQIVHSVPQLIIEVADCIVNTEDSLCKILARL